jgi:hypothetical protein
MWHEIKLKNSYVNFSSNFSNEAHRDTMRSNKNYFSVRYWMHGNGWDSCSNYNRRNWIHRNWFHRNWIHVQLQAQLQPQRCGPTDLHSTTTTEIWSHRFASTTGTEMWTHRIVTLVKMDPPYCEEVEIAGHLTVVALEFYSDCNCTVDSGNCCYNCGETLLSYYGPFPVIPLKWRL